MADIIVDGIVGALVRDGSGREFIMWRTPSRQPSDCPRALITMKQEVRDGKIIYVLDGEATEKMQQEVRDGREILVDEETGTYVVEERIVVNRDEIYKLFRASASSGVWRI